MRGMDHGPEDDSSDIGLFHGNFCGCSLRTDEISVSQVLLTKHFLGGGLFVLPGTIPKQLKGCKYTHITMESSSLSKEALGVGSIPRLVASLAAICAKCSSSCWLCGKAHSVISPVGVVARKA